jgi:hypothetical protein
MQDEKTAEDFDYLRYKQLLAEATDEPRRIALIELLVKESARDKLAAQRVKQQVAQFVGSRDVSVGSFSVATSPAEFIVEEGLAQRAEDKEINTSSRVMKKPGKTAAELEAMIKVEMEAISDRPTGAIVSVQPDGDSWKAHVVSEGSVDDADLHDMITQIADRLKAEIDLNE